MKINFIDGGAHIGQFLKRCFDESWNIKTNPKTGQPFFKIPNALGAKFYLFEPNPKCIPKLNILSKKYKDFISIEVFPCLLWKINGQQIYYEDKFDSQANGLFPELRPTLQNPRLIDCINLHNFLVSKCSTKDSYNIIKLDIEGSEYEVLKSILYSDSLPFVNELYVEWHFSRKRREEKRKIIERIKELNITYDTWDF